MQGGPRQRWAPTLACPPRRCGRSASGIWRAAWSGRCSMRRVLGKLRRWIRSNGNALSPWPVRSRRKAGRAGRGAFWGGGGGGGKRGRGGGGGRGGARWTVRLLAEEAVKRKLVPRVGRETVRILLQSHDLKPWREKNVVRGPAR